MTNVDPPPRLISVLRGLAVCGRFPPGSLLWHCTRACCVARKGTLRQASMGRVGPMVVWSCVFCGDRGRHLCVSHNRG